MQSGKPPSLKLLKEQFDSRSADFRAAQSAFAKERKSLITATDRVADCEEAQKVAQLVAHTVQEQAHRKISSVVSRCLGAVFDEPYEFKIIFEPKRGRTDARLVFVRDEQEIDPMTASGGGVIDVASFALRLACIMLSKPAVRRVLVMDEPFKFVSAGYVPRVRAMLEQLAAEMRVQFIFVTHVEGLKTGTVVEL